MPRPLTNCESAMKKKSTGGFIRSLSYMTASLVLFVLSFGVSVFLLIRAAGSGGAASAAAGAMGIAALVCSAAGFVIALYGHFIVRIDTKTDWRLGVILNGLLTLFLIFLYFLGIR